MKKLLTVIILTVVICSCKKETIVTDEPTLRETNSAEVTPENDNKLISISGSGNIDWLIWNCSGGLATEQIRITGIIKYSIKYDLAQRHYVAMFHYLDFTGQGETSGKQYRAVGRDITVVNTNFLINKTYIFSLRLVGEEQWMISGVFHIRYDSSGNVEMAFDKYTHTCPDE